MIPWLSVIKPCFKILTLLVVNLLHFLRWLAESQIVIQDYYCSDMYPFLQIWIFGHFPHHFLNLKNKVSLLLFVNTNQCQAEHKSFIINNGFASQLWKCIEKKVKSLKDFFQVKLLLNIVCIAVNFLFKLEKQLNPVIFYHQ